MSPTLYAMKHSPPCRAVFMTAEAIGLSLEIKEINVQKGEHLTPEYLKLNPQHTVPTFVDENGFVVWDSHVIITYLVSKYAKDDSLYPKDLQKRSVINQRLHFDSGVLFAHFLKVDRPIVYDFSKTVSPEDVDETLRIYEFLESFLDLHDWVAGDTVTLADFSLLATATSLDFLVPVDPGKFPKIVAWFKRAESLPVWDANKKGLDIFVDMMKSKMKD